MVEVQEVEWKGASSDGDECRERSSLGGYEKEDEEDYIICNSRRVGKVCSAKTVAMCR